MSHSDDDHPDHRYHRDHRDERGRGDNLQQAIEEVLGRTLDDRQVEEAAARVWGKLAGMPGCRDFGPQIPAYLLGELAPARALLLEDHTRECLSCRRALRAARQQRDGRIALHEIVEEGWRPAPPPRARQLPRATGWLALAALLLVSIGLGTMIIRALGPAAKSGVRLARVETVEGRLYRIAGASSVPVRAGDAIRQGDQVRTAKASRAVLRMKDGSQIEMAERAGLALAAGSGGNTIDLERGLIIVQAAKQRPRHLYVATADCLVSVTGTIFAVNHGTKGSRVSVVEGEVHVKLAQPARLSQLAEAAVATPGESVENGDVVLHPGGQVTTQANVAAVPVGQEVAWSRDSARYQTLLAELGAAGSAIDRQVARPAVRNASRLLDLVPAGTLVYVAVPNLAANLEHTQQLLDERLAESPVLRQWWSETLGSPANEQLFHDLVQEVGNVGRYLGDEVVVVAAGSPAPGGAAGSAGPAAGSGPPVLLAETAQEALLRDSLREEIATVNRRAARTAMVLLDRLPNAGESAGSPASAAARATAPEGGGGSGGGASRPLLVWVGEGLLVASPSAEQIAAVGANLRPGAANPFAASSFHARLAQAYADGAGWLFAADLKQLMAARSTGEQGPSRLADAMGVFDLEHFVLERHDGAAGGPAPAAAPAGDGSAATTETRAALTFSQPRRGIASWLAAPAPMGSLGFFSADANLVAAFVVKNPVELLDELLSLSPEFAAELAKAEAEHGFSLRDDLAAPLGGEIALGLDGPVLPSPSWRLVAEVYDPVRLQQTFARAVSQANARLAAEGKPGVKLGQEQAGSRTYYTIACDQPSFEMHYLFADGYLVAAPTRAQLDRALAQRAAGTTLASSPRLRGLLGRDGQVNVSALFYQNLAPVLSLVGGAAGRSGGAGAAGTPGGHRHEGRGGPPAGLGSLLFGGGHGPSLLYAYAEPDRIVFAGHTEAGPMGLNLETLAGFGGILGGIERAHGAAVQGSRATRGQDGSNGH
jgi:ferric-dicitrate binding protein FerR (iron transport regulator)